jgi:hypothetical protein
MNQETKDNHLAFSLPRLSLRQNLSLPVRARLDKSIAILGRLQGTMAVRRDTSDRPSALNTGSVQNALDIQSPRELATTTSARR